METIDNKYFTVKYSGSAENHFMYKPSSQRFSNNYEACLDDYIKSGNTYNLIKSNLVPLKVMHEGVDYFDYERGQRGVSPIGYLMPTSMYNDIFNFLKLRSNLISKDGQKVQFIGEELKVYPLTIGLTISSSVLYGNINFNITEAIMSHVKEVLLRVMTAMTIGKSIETFNTPQMIAKPMGLSDYSIDHTFTENLSPDNIINITKRGWKSQGMGSKWIVNHETIFNMLYHSPNADSSDLNRIFNYSVPPNPVSNMPISIYHHDICYEYYMPVDSTGDPIAILYNPYKFMNHLYPEISIRRISLKSDFLNKDTLFLVTVLLGTSCLDASSISCINFKNNIIPFEEVY